MTKLRTKLLLSVLSIIGVLLFFVSRTYAQLVVDSLSDTAGTNLSAHTAQMGGGWTKNATANGGDIVATTSPFGYMRNSGTSDAWYYSAASPASTDYYIVCNFYYAGAATNGYIGIVARMDTSAKTGYELKYQLSNGTWTLSRWVAGSRTQINAAAQTLTVGTTYSVAMLVQGPSISCYVNGALLFGGVQADAGISVAGKVGVSGNGTGNSTDFNGILLDNYYAAPITTPFAAPLAISNVTASGATVQAQSNSFGTAPFAYAYQRASDNAGVPGTWTTLSTQTGVASGTSPNPYTDTTASGGTKYYYRVQVTDSAGTPITATGQFASITTSIAQVTLLPNNAAIYYSGGSGVAWYVNGSTYAQTNMQGTYFKLNFSGTSAVLNVDVSPLTTASVASTNYPRLAWIIDGGVMNTFSITSTTASVSLASGLAPGTHALTVWVMGLGGSDLWTTPSDVFRFTGITLDPGASASAPALQPNGTWWAFGDSTTAGNSLLGSQFNTLTTSDGTQTYVARAADGLGFEYTPLAFGGQGWVQTGASGSNVVPLYTPGNDAASSWNKLDGAGHSRNFAVPPTLITIQQGRNDYSKGSSDASISASVSGFLTALRTAVGATTKIVVLVPADGSKRAAILAGFISYAGTYSSSTTGNGATWYRKSGDNTYLFDLGTTLQTGLNGSTASFASYDGVHPNVWKHAEEATRFVQLYQSGVGATFSGSGTKRKVQ